MTLAEFLLARLADEEAAARAAPGPRWVRKYRQRPEPPFAVERYAIASPVEFAGQELGTQVVAFTEDDTAESKALVEHAVRWDPARVLAECRVKRRIVELHKPYQRIHGLGCEACLLPRHLPPDAPGWPCQTLQALALTYAWHPDYDHGTSAA